MSIDDLKEKIYKRDFGNSRKHEESEYDPLIKQHKNPAFLGQERMWINGEDNFSEQRKKIIKIGVIVVGVAVLLASIVVAIVKYKQSAFNEEKVIISIEGPDVSETTEPLKYVIKYKNNNRVDISDAEILLNYSDNFQPEKSENFNINNAASGKIFIGNIKAYSEGEVSFKGRFYAPKDFTAYINGTLNYKPENFNSYFQSKSQKGVLVKTSPVILDIIFPLEAASGDKVEYVIDYKNFSDRYLDNLRLKVDYPSGFSFHSSEPASSEGNNFWYLGALDKSEAGKIKIKGIINGQNKESKVVNVSIGISDGQGNFVVYTTKEKMTKIIGSPLTISQLVNGMSDTVVNAGEELNYKLEYANKGDIGLRDVIVSLEIDSPVLDFSRIKLLNGHYNASKKMIIWKASEVPDLAVLPPGKSGIISFSVPVRERIPMETENDKNYTIVSLVKIDSPDVPAQIGSNKIISSSKMEMKLNSKITLESKGYYNDAFISNSGPIPPKVGEKTTYTVVWQITNISNDISGVRVVSSMPSGIKWGNKIHPQDENLEYNERTNQIIWNVGNLKSGVGILGEKREIRFQVELTPQVNNIGTFPAILSQSILSAKDNFTGRDLKFETREVTTKIESDLGVSNNGYKVID